MSPAEFPPDPTPRPLHCTLCGCAVFWRLIATRVLHCQDCKPIAIPATGAYWYIAD
mgnify:CR=1 FL=1